MRRANLRGAFVVGREAARRVRGGRAIVNFSSLVVRLALRAYTPYAATTGAVDAMTMISPRSCAPATSSSTPWPPARARRRSSSTRSEDEIDRLASMPPLECLGSPGDIAETVAHLAGRARWINGQVIYANGGIA
jgi:3-oxoacyl-[acyl-carrier protein] reductase